MNSQILEALAVTAEVLGTTLSKGAVQVMAADLEPYPPHQVLGALKRCRKEVKGRLTLADIIARLDDGRPGSEEAWAMIPHDEHSSVVWTDEMAHAFGIAHQLILHGDVVAARMAFKETYLKSVQLARENALPVRWTPSLGRDRSDRERALKEAVELGRLSPGHAELIEPAPIHSLPAGNTYEAIKLARGIVKAKREAVKQLPPPKEPELEVAE